MSLPELTVALVMTPSPDERFVGFVSQDDPHDQNFHVRMSRPSWIVLGSPQRITVAVQGTDDDLSEAVAAMSTWKEED